MHRAVEVGWGVVVPAMEVPVADSLWGEWLSSTGAAVAASDVRIETIASPGGDLRSYSVRGVRCMSIHEVARAISDDCEIGKALVQEHLADWYPEVLDHLLVAELRRHVEQLDKVSDCAFIAHVDRAMSSGDAAVQNAVAVSFVEDWGWWDLPAAALDTWPETLRAEVARQRNWTPREP